MPDYRRFFAPGGTFFFTLVTYARKPLFDVSTARQALHEAIAETRALHPFDMPGVVVLPDRLHCLWTLPAGDTDCSIRWQKINEVLTRTSTHSGRLERVRLPGRRRKGRREFWQRRSWKRTIRDEKDFGRHLDYIHCDPIKHGWVTCAHTWPYSSFQRWVTEGFYDETWCCSCRNPAQLRPRFGDIDDSVWQ